MKTRHEPLPGTESASMPEASPGWSAALGLTALAILALLSIYHSTFASMVSIWWRSETFAHGFVIFPISIWLIWRLRLQVARISPKPDYRALPVLFGLGLMWLMMRVADIQVGEQFAAVVMLPVICWMMLGWSVLDKLAFPLGFLLFSVPFGEFLIPSMMDFTANFTVKMLRLTGIPVYRDGTFFSIPSGDWSVVEGCSGLRYLIASITLGCLYAYLTYRSQVRRLVFVILALIFPVIANGLRAYMIVMIAHLSDMKLALGVDHFIYGWVFFGFVMLFMFWIGSFWSESQADDNSLSSAAAATRAEGFDTVSLAKSGAAVLACSLFWPVWAAHIDELRKERDVPVSLQIPQPVSPWQPAAPLTEWEPTYVGPDTKVKAFFADDSGKVGLYIMYYRNQKQGAELINSQNVLIRQKHPVWKMPQEKLVEIQLKGVGTKVWQGRLSSSDQNLLTWRWNWISGRYTANDLFGKFLESKDKMFGTIRDGAAIIVVTEYDDDVESATRTLQGFVDTMLPVIEESLKRAAES
jgi:exosortase A